jgi:hypothetical protein
VNIEYWDNPKTGLPHILDHSVEPAEVAEVFSGKPLLRPGRDGTTVALGPTVAGRFLKIVFRKREDGVIFVITGYAASANSVKLYRRYYKKKQK